MSSSRDPKPGGQGPLLKTWRYQGPSGARAKLWLITRRAVAFLIAVSLLGWLGYLLFSPMMLPKTYFAHAFSDNYQLLSASPIEFPYEDFAGFSNLAQALTPLASEEPAPFYVTLQSPASADELFDALDNSSIGDRDVVILCVVAHGIVYEDQAYLKCGNLMRGATGKEVNKGLYPISRLLERVGNLPGATKLLLIDAGREDVASDQQSRWEFAKALKQEVESGSLPSSLWVLSANSPGESSHVTYGLRRSVFGHLVAQGLLGAADFDKNEELFLDEFSKYVRLKVAEWVETATGGAETQIPVLMRAGGESIAGNSPHLLYTAGLPKVKNKQSDEETGVSVGSIFRILGDRVKEFGVSPVSAAVNKAEKLSEDDEEINESGSDKADSSLGVSAYEQFASQRNQLINSVWQHIEELEAISADPTSTNYQPHPREYAPGLWRHHLDTALWLESFQRAGVLPVRKHIVENFEELRSVESSLKAMLQGESKPTRSRNIIDQIRELQPSWPIDPTEAPTLGLAETIARQSNQPLAENLQKFISSYDGWIAENQSLVQFKAILEQLWSEDWAGFHELGLLQYLLEKNNIALPTCREALAVRRLGERVVSNRLWGQGWASEAVRRADRSRREAERLLLSQASSDWQDRASEKLTEASKYYLQAEREIGEVEDAIRLLDEVRICLPDYYLWSLQSLGDSLSEAPSRDELQQLLELFESLKQALDNTDVKNFEFTQQVYKQLAAIQNKVSEGYSSANLKKFIASPYEAGDAMRINALLHTALLGAEERMKCRGALAEAEQAVMPSFEYLSLPAVSQSLRRPKNRSKLASEFSVLEVPVPTAPDRDEADWTRPYNDLHSEQLWRLLVSSRQRRLDAVADATEKELETLLTQVNRFGNLAAKVSDNRDPELIPSPELSLSLRDPNVELETGERADFNLEVSSSANTPVWIMAEYDERFLRVQGKGWTVLNEHEVRRSIDHSNNAEYVYPFQPKTFSISPTLELVADQPRLLELTVSRVKPTGGNASLVIKAITASDYLRRQLAVRLPGRSDIELLLTDAKDNLFPLNKTIYLLSNRSQDYTLQVANKTDQAKTIKAYLYSPTELPTQKIPPGTVLEDSAIDILSSFGISKRWIRQRQIAQTEEVIISQQGKPAPLEFEFAQPLQRNGDVAPIESTAITHDLPHGLLIDIVDQESNEHTIRFLEFEVWKPASFLTAHADYNPGEEELSVFIEATEPSRIPNTGLQAKLEVMPEYLSTRGEQIELTTLRPNGRGELTVKLNGKRPRDFDSESTDYLPAYVHIDEYPRAFEFRIAKAIGRQKLSPVSNPMGIRILEPRNGEEFRTKKILQVRVAADAPSKSTIEIGLDKDKDRELEGEDPVPFDGDRQVEVSIGDPLGEGSLSLGTRVKDFEIELPVAGVSGEVNILAQIKNSARVLNSGIAYHGITLDGSPPEFSAAKFIPEEKHLLVEVNVSDATEVSTVKAAFDSSTKVEWVDAKPRQGGKWVAKLDASKLPVGSHTVLLKATDKVGNESGDRLGKWDKKSTQSLQNAVKIVESGGSEQSSQKPRGIKNRLSGRATYGKNEVTRLKVTISGAGAPTNPPKINGATFDFGMVSPGKYILNARGRSGGNPRSGETEIVVSDQPNTPARAVINIR